ncbi:hypothetical protein MKX03_015566 [Papaver bracteatum]|nr:hypothetical protein MKX03_015566 [Papaver bracteatum]
MGWQVGFVVPAVLMFLSALSFFLGNSFYIKVKASTGLFTGFAEVFVAAWRNGRLDLGLATQPINSDGVYYSKDLKLVAPSNNLRYHSHQNHFLIICCCYHYVHLLFTRNMCRFLNKACIVRDPDEDLKPDLPNRGSSAVSQNSLPVLQAKTMDRHITTNFDIPAGSFALFTITTLTIWVAFYDRVIVPIIVRYTGKPNGINATIRMGIGLLLSCIAMAGAGIAERIRRRNSVEENFSISAALWLIPQFCLNGLAEAFNAIGQIEFYYRQLPKSMSSIAVAFFTLDTAFLGLLGGLILSVVDKVTKSGDSKDSWFLTFLSHYDCYYWFLTFLSVVNFFYFVICSWCYGPCGEEENTRDTEDAAEVNEGMLGKV